MSNSSQQKSPGLKIYIYTYFAHIIAFAIPFALAWPAVQYSCLALQYCCLAVPQLSTVPSCPHCHSCPQCLVAHTLPSAPSSFLASLTMHHPQHLFIPIINFTIPTISTIWTIALDHIHMLWVIWTYIQKRITSADSAFQSKKI